MRYSLSAGALDESITEHSGGKSGSGNNNILIGNSNNHGTHQMHEYFDGFTYATSPATAATPESALPAPPTHLHHNKKHPKMSMYVS